VQKSGVYCQKGSLAVHHSTKLQNNITFSGTPPLPDAIPFDDLTPNNPKQNLSLAFEAAA